MKAAEPLQWFYLVEEFYTDSEHHSTKEYWHKEKAVALERAKNYIQLDIKNAGIRRMMNDVDNQPTYNKVYLLYYAELISETAYEMTLIEQHNLADYMGNYSLV